MELSRFSKDFWGGAFVHLTPSVLPHFHPAIDRRGRQAENGGEIIPYLEGITIFMGTLYSPPPSVRTCPALS